MDRIPGAPVRRADHIGSLLRPRALKDAYNAWRAGTLDAAGFEAVRAKAIRDVVALQEGTGLEVVTDGEFRRQSWFAGFVDAVAGLTNKPTHFNFTDDHGSDVPTKVPYVTAKLARTRVITTGEFESLRTTTTRIPKITLPAPSVIQFFRGKDSISPDVYPDVDHFWADLVRICRQEVAELAARGCVYIQLDEVPVALLFDPTIRERVASWGSDPDELMGTYINATNTALDSRPESMAVASTSAAAISAATGLERAAMMPWPSGCLTTPR